MRNLFVILLWIFSPGAFAQEVISINGVNCDIHGSANYGSKPYTINVYKNRFILPKPSDFDSRITFQNLINSADPNGFYYDKAITLTGYIYNVKEGGVESCNCKTKDEAYRDTHIELTPDETRTGPEYRVIVEVTPRLRTIMAAKGVDWSTEGLRKTIKGHKATIAGWLFYDPEHEDGAFANDPTNERGAQNWRATCWEIHPITSITILDGNTNLRNPVRPVQQPQQDTSSGNNSNFNYFLLGIVCFIVIILILLLSSRK